MLLELHILRSTLCSKALIVMESKIKPPQMVQLVSKLYFLEIAFFVMSYFEFHSNFPILLAFRTNCKESEILTRVLVFYLLSDAVIYTKRIQYWFKFNLKVCTGESLQASSSARNFIIFNENFFTDKRACFDM